MGDAELLELVKTAGQGGNIIGISPRTGKRITSVHPPQEQWESSPRNKEPRSNLPNTPGVPKPPSVIRKEGEDVNKAGAWQAIPGGRKGGQRRPKAGGGFEYQYETAADRKAGVEHHEAKALAARKQQVAHANTASDLRSNGEHAMAADHEDHAADAKRDAEHHTEMAAQSKTAKIVPAGGELVSRPDPQRGGMAGGGEGPKFKHKNTWIDESRMIGATGDYQIHEATSGGGFYAGFTKQGTSGLGKPVGTGGVHDQLDKHPTREAARAAILAHARKESKTATKAEEDGMSINPLDILAGRQPRMELVKASYVKREAKPGGGYRYTYASHPDKAEWHKQSGQGGADHFTKETEHGEYIAVEHPSKPGHHEVSFTPRTGEKNGGGLRDEQSYTLGSGKPVHAGADTREFHPGGMAAVDKKVAEHHAATGPKHAALRELEDRHSDAEPRSSPDADGGKYANWAEAGRNIEMAHKFAEANPEMADRFKARAEKHVSENPGKAKKSDSAPLDLIKASPPRGGIVRMGSVDYAVAPHQEPSVRDLRKGLLPPLRDANEQPSHNAPAEDPLTLLRTPGGMLTHPNGVDRRR